MVLNDIFLKVLNMSVTASWVILAILLLRLCLTPKKYAYALWAAAGFRLVCPVSFTSALSLFNLRLGPKLSPTVDLTAVPGYTYNTIQPSVQVGIPPVNNAIDGSLPGPAPMASVNPMQIIVWIIGIVWCAGMIGMLLYAAVSYIRLRRRMREAVLLEGNVFQSEKVQSPFILGFFRPKIYIPYGLESEKLDYVLAHERTHLRRGDHVVKPIAFLILTVHWFNPLVWLAFSLLCRDMELSCDEKVLGKTGNSKGYSQTLLAIAAGRRFPAPSPLAFGEGDVRCRIKNALKWKKPTLWLTILAAALCVLGIVICASDPQEDEGFYPFADTYKAEEIVYQSPLSSFYYTPEILPQFVLSDDRALYLRNPHAAEGGAHAGAFREVELTAENFDGYFLAPYGDTGTQLRKNNKRAWKLVTESGDYAYHLLEQKNGDLIMTHGGAGAPNAMKLADGIRWAAKLTERNQVWCSVDGNSHYDMAWYADGFDFDYRELPTMTVDGSGVLEFHADWDTETLRVSEDYYEDRSGMTQISRNTYILAKDADGVFRLPAGRRNDTDAHKEYAIYFVEDGDARHVLRVGFAKGGMEDYVPTMTPDAVLDAFQADGQFAACEDLNAVAVTDGAYGLKGVVRYADEEGNRACFAFWRDDIWYTVKLGAGELRSPEAGGGMSYWEDGKVQLILEDSTNGSWHLYTIGWSPTEDGYNFTAESERVESPLERSVTAAVYRENHTDGVEDTARIPAHSAVILGVEYPRKGEVKVYAQTLYEEFEASASPDSLKMVYGISVPAVMVFRDNGNDGYTLMSYETPGDGSYYDDDVRRIFGSYAEAALDSQTYALALQQACHAMAAGNVGLDTDSAVEYLFWRMGLSPAESSNPGDYVDAHPEEYRELLYYGDYTLQYIFRNFLEGGETGLHGHLMRIVMDDLIGGEAMPLEAMTGQEYFDAWKAHAEKIWAQNGDGYMRNHAPKSWMLLQMMN